MEEEEEEVDSKPIEPLRRSRTRRRREEGGTSQRRTSTSALQSQREGGDTTDEGYDTVVAILDPSDDRPFVPSIKIKRMDDSILISALVLKQTALSSDLFAILEEEKLDIVYEHQYRTETKVSYTILVNLSQGYDVDAFKEKLCEWARKDT